MQTLLDVGKEKRDIEQAEGGIGTTCQPQNPVFCPSYTQPAVPLFATHLVNLAELPLLS